MTDYDDVLYPDAREPEPQVRPFEQGIVLGVSDAGVRFTLDSFPPTVGFGPAPCVGTPDVGDKCLVAFAGAGVGEPWVVAWAPA